MRSFRFFVAVIMFLGIASCSWITDFVVANRSDLTITLAYKFKAIQNSKSSSKKCIDINRHGVPLVTAGTNLRRSNDNWQKLTPTEFVYDSNSCEVSLDLKPGEAARITSMPTYTGHKSGRADFFLIQSLTIKSPIGLIQYEGFELLKGFKKRSDELYVFYYEG